MTVTVKIHWKGADGPVAELQFAYPLTVGSTFVLQSEEDNLVCTVDMIMHYPINAGSEHSPAVGYFVSKTRLKSLSSPWWRAKEAAKVMAKGLLKLK